MDVPEWKDITSFSQGEKDRTPRTWQIQVGRVRVVVTRHIHYSPTAWLLRCENFGIEEVLASSDIEDAKKEALATIRSILSGALAYLDLCVS